MSKTCHRQRGRIVASACILLRACVTLSSRLLPPHSLLFGLILFFLPTAVFAWPADSDWIGIPRGLSLLSDPQNDAIGNDARDIVGDATRPVAYVFNDGNYVYYRIRVDRDPHDNTGISFSPFGWGFLIDTNGNSDDYEFMVMIDGIANPEVMYVAKNTLQGTLGDASDKAELIMWQENLSYNVNYRVVSAGTIFPVASPTPDYFVDWKIPFDVFKSSLGVSDNTLIRYFVGSANNAMVLNADLCEGSGNTSLANGLSNFILPNGQQPVTGSVTFVTALDGSGDLTEFYAGSTVYLRVSDNDRNAVKSAAEQVVVTVVAPSGDSQDLVLTETGADTGIFTGALATEDGAAVAGDGILQVSPIEIIVVRYLDSADAYYLLDQLRTDTARALPAADLAVNKSVDHPTPNENEAIKYTVTVTNNGPSGASGIQITDLLPTGVTYAGDDGGGSYNPATGLWSAGSLARGTSRSLVIDATVNPGTFNTTITNTATRTAAAQPDPNSANDSATATIAITGIDLAVAKSASTVTPPVSGTVVFTLTVSNLSAGTATGVRLTDLLPAGTWTAITVGPISQGSYTTATGVWDIGSLAGGAVATLQLSAQLQAGVAGGTPLTNTASISHSDQADPATDNNSASVALVVGGVDLALNKTVNNASPDEGGTVVFTVTVSNSATAATSASGIAITDLLPAGLTWLSDTPSAGSYNRNTGLWSGFSLAPGGSATLILTAGIDAGTAGQTLTNSAAVTALTQSDVNLANNSASCTVTVRHTDLQVTKSVSNATPADKTNIVYTIMVKNLGPLAASNVTVFDQLPGQSSYVSHVAPAGTTYSTATNLWTVGNLAVGQELTLTITAYVNIGNNPKSFFNSAYLNSCTPGDNNGTNDVSLVTVTINGTDLGITKTMNTGYTSYPVSGASTQFLITLTNYGPNTATGITVKDIVPAGLSCDSATIVQGGGGFTNAGGKCDWTPANLAPNASAILRLNSTVSAATGSILTNRVSITAVDQADPNAGNNSASQVLYVGATDLALAKGVDNPTPVIGDTVTFSITLTNNGTNTVTGITVTDLLPAGLTYLSHSAPAGTTYNSASGVWNVGTLAFPGNTTLTLRTTVDAGTGGTVITNSASISAAGSFDPIAANNSASAAITVQQADVYVTKTATTLTPFAGDSVTFTVVAGNTGPNSATGVTVRDQLPAGLTYLSHVAAAGTSYDPLSGDWSVGTLAKSGSATLTVTATVDPGTHGSTLINTASKTAAVQTDPNSANDSASINLTPQLLQIDLALTKIVDDPTPAVGSNVVFTIGLFNLHGTRPATGIVVTDTLPAGLTFVSAVVSAGSLTATPAVGASGNIVWGITPLAAMSNATLTITAQVAAGTSGLTLTNNATITAQAQADPNLANNSASRSVVPQALPSITVLKSADRSKVNSGGTVTYTITTRNTGAGSATVVTAIDNLSPFVALVLDYDGLAPLDQPFDFDPGSSGLTAGTPVYYDAGGVFTPDFAAGVDGNVVRWELPLNGSFGAGGEFTIRFKVRVK